MPTDSSNPYPITRPGFKGRLVSRTIQELLEDGFTREEIKEFYQQHVCVHPECADFAIPGPVCSKHAAWHRRCVEWWQQRDADEVLRFVKERAA